jgi:hypothetical protein
MAGRARSVALAAAGVIALVAPLVVELQPAGATVWTATTREDFDITLPGPPIGPGGTFTCTVQDDASHDTVAHTATATGSVPGVCGGLEYELYVEVSAKDENGQVRTVSSTVPPGPAPTLDHAVSAVTTTVTVTITDLACASNCSHTVHANPK